MAATENRQNDPLGGCKHRQLGKVIGISSRARQRRQHVRIAMVDTETGEFTEKTLGHAGDAVRGFYAALEGPVVVGIEAIGCTKSLADGTNYVADMLLRADAKQIVVKTQNLDYKKVGN
jgi:hypothetical protein